MSENGDGGEKVKIQIQVYRVIDNWKDNGLLRIPIRIRDKPIFCVSVFFETLGGRPQFLTLESRLTLTLESKFWTTNLNLGALNWYFNNI